MSDTHRVSITNLIEISDGLIELYFFSNDLYALLLLSLMTVTTYSRKKHKLTTQTRLDLSITFLPELIQSLIKNETIDKKTAEILSAQCKSRSSELSTILEAYLYAGKGLQVKDSKLDRTDSKKKEEKCVLC